MTKCPFCKKEIYWVIVKGKVFSIPFSYKDINSNKAKLLNIVGFKACIALSVFAPLKINNIKELIKFFGETMRIVRCPKCGDIITEEDVVARDDKGNFTFRHCGQYWHVQIEKADTREIITNELPTSQCWLTFNRPISRVTTASEDSNETV